MLHETVYLDCLNDFCSNDEPRVPGIRWLSSVDADTLKTRYLQIEAFDYNLTPWLKVTWT